MGSPVVHWELMSKDPAKVAGFYERIFGWKVQHRLEPGMGKFSLFTDPEGRMMGLWKSKMK